MINQNSCKTGLVSLQREIFFKRNRPTLVLIHIIGQLLIDSTWVQIS